MTHSSTIQLSDNNLEILKRLFESEPNFQAQTVEDYVIVEILRRIIKNAQPILEGEVETVPQ